MPKASVMPSGEAKFAVVLEVQSMNEALKRNVDRKDKALAESAALLVLSKKIQALLEDEDQ